MKYKPLIDMTDEEIKTIVKDIYNPKDIISINRDLDYEEINVVMITEWENSEDEKEEYGEDIFDVEDEITLTCDKIQVPFSSSKDDYIKWQQFLMAKGYHKSYKLLIDNPYVSI